MNKMSLNSQKAHFVTVCVLSVSNWRLPACLFRDLLHMGVTLAGHQRKILSSIQTLTFRSKNTATVTF